MSTTVATSIEDYVKEKLAWVKEKIKDLYWNDAVYHAYYDGWEDALEEILEEISMNDYKGETDGS